MPAAASNIDIMTLGEPIEIAQSSSAFRILRGRYRVSGQEFGAT